MKVYKVKNATFQIVEIEIEGWSKTGKSVYVKGRGMLKRQVFESYHATREEAVAELERISIKQLKKHHKAIERIEKALGMNCQKPEKVSYPVKMCKRCNTNSFIETSLHEGFCTNCTMVSRLIKDYKRRS